MAYMASDDRQGPKSRVDLGSDKSSLEEPPDTYRDYLSLSIAIVC
jgi:hypothetical protein